MAVAEKKETAVAVAEGKTLVKVSRRRDGDMNDIYACCIGVDGEIVSVSIPLDTEVLLDNNIIESIKQRTEFVRTSSEKGGETLVAKPTYLIEKV